MSRLAALALVALAAAPAARAQTEERLPDLTPSVFEIQGPADAVVSLPQVERQPLFGFGPPPRTYVVPAEREPATRPYDAPADALPRAELPAPPEPDFALAEGQNGRVEGGFGTHVARYGRLDLALPAARGVFFLDGDYDGLAATLDASATAPGARQAYDRVGTRFGYTGYGRVRPLVEGGFRFDTYTLPGAVFATETPERRLTAFDLGAGLETDASTVLPALVRLRYTAARAAFLDEATAPSEALQEGRLDGEARLDLLRGAIRLEGAAGTAGRGSGGLGDDARHYGAGALIRLRRAGGLLLDVGVRVLGYDASPENGGGESRIAAPVVRFEMPVAVGLLYARTDGTVAPRGLADVLAENPYTVGQPLLVPELRQVDAEGGLQVRRGPLGLKAYVGAQRVPTYLYYERDAGTGLFDANYSTAQIALAGGDLTLVGPAGIEASAGAAYRYGRLSELDGEIPYFAPFVGRFGLQVPFGQGRGRVGLAGYVEGDRPTDRTGAVTLPGFRTLALDAAYRVAGGIAVVVRGERLLGETARWEGYPQPGATLMGGARLVW